MEGFLGEQISAIREAIRETKAKGDVEIPRMRKLRNDIPFFLVAILHRRSSQTVLVSSVSAIVDICVSMFRVKTVMSGEVHRRPKTGFDEIDALYA